MFLVVWRGNRMKKFLTLKYLLLLLLLFTMIGKSQFTINGDPRVNPDDFIITTFAEGLNFPVGMDVLPDQSIVVIVTNEGFFGSTTGRLIQLIDADNDGVAETETVMNLSAAAEFPR